MNRFPLVTVIVATFNQEKIVCETLDSILTQTYSNIELIVTDDCSPDNTVSVCKKWINEHRNRFCGCNIVEGSRNTGIACSLNRALNETHGEWIRIVAGDDLLPNKSIEQYVDYVLCNKITTICNSFSAEFIDTGKMHIVGYRPDAYLKNIYSFDARNQHLTLIREGLCFIGCTVFISRNFLTTMNGYDETFPMIEDWPMFLKATSSGNKVYFAENIIGCLHRVGQESVSNSGSSFLSLRAYGKKGLFDQLVNGCIKAYGKDLKIKSSYHYNLDKIRRYTIIYLFGNKKNLVTRMVNKIFLSLDPFVLKRVLYNRKNNIQMPTINMKKVYEEVNDQ